MRPGRRTSPPKAEYPQMNRGHTANRCKMCFSRKTPSALIEGCSRANWLKSFRTVTRSRKDWCATSKEENSVPGLTRSRRNQLEPGGFTHIRRHVRFPRDLLECGQVVVEVTVDALASTACRSRRRDLPRLPSRADRLDLVHLFSRQPELERTGHAPDLLT